VGALVGAAIGLTAGTSRHPALAALAAALGLLMSRFPEPTFFLLVPALAAGAFWPFDPPPEPRPTPRWAVPATFLFAAAVFFLQSAGRHWTFGSGGKDLGLMYQTHWLIAHGLVPYNTVMDMHALADHMTFVDFLVAPLLRLHDSATTLLFVQATGVASAVFPLFGLGRRLLGRDRWALTLAWLWLLSPDVHSGVMFDYNQTPLGSTALLWTAWALVCRGPVAILLASLLACSAKTNLCLYVAAIAVVLGLRAAVSWRRAAAVAALALAIFVLELTVLFPMFREGGFRHWEFEEIGDQPAEIFRFMAAHPVRTAKVLLNHQQKRRALLQPLAATGYLGAAEPLSLLMQIPNWGERFLSTHRTRWWGYYYGMPAVATALVGLALGWARLVRAGRAGPRSPHYLVACALLVGLLPPYKSHDGDPRSMLYTRRRPYASPPEDVHTQRDAVRYIGRDPRLRVAAQHHLLPHLAGRPFIVMLDRAGEADVVALQLDGGTWPEGRPAWRRRVQELWATGAYHVAFCEGQTVVLDRRPGEGVPCPAWQALMEAPLPPADQSQPELQEVGGAHDDLAPSHLAAPRAAVHEADRHLAEAAVAGAGCEVEHLHQERVARGVELVPRHQLQQRRLIGAEARGAVEGRQEEEDPDEPVRRGAEQSAVEGPGADLPPARITGPDDDVGPRQRGEHPRDVAGIVREVGVHGDDGRAAPGEREAEPVCQRGAEAPRALAVDHGEVRAARGEPIGDRTGAVRRPVVHDEHVRAGLGGADGRDEIGEVLALVEGGQDDPRPPGRQARPLAMACSSFR